MPSRSLSDKSLSTATSIFFLLGAAVVLPWNAYITAVDYFTELFPDYVHIDRIFSVVYIPATLLSTVVGAKLPVKVKVIAGLLGYVLSLLVVPVADSWHEEAGGTSGLLLLVCAVILVGFCNGLVQPALFAEASHTHYKCVQALQAGNGASAVIVITLRMASKGLGGRTTEALRISTFVYFGIAMLFCVLTYTLYIYGLPKLLVYQAGRRASSLNLLAKSHKTQVQTVSLVSEEASASPFAQPLVTPAQQSVYLIDESGITAPGTIIAQDAEGGGTSEPLLSNVLPTLGVSDDEEEEASASHKELLHKLRVPAISIFLTYLMTLSIFPGFLSEDVQSKALGDWYPILLFFTFAVTDYTSRVFMVKDNVMLIISVGRILLCPGFAYCSLYGASPVFVFILTSIFGFTNGLLTNTAMLSASKHASFEHAEEAGTVMSFSLHLGLLLGSYCGWIWLVI